MTHLYQQLERISQQWIDRGLPSRQQVIDHAMSLRRWRRQHGDQGLWRVAPHLVTATLDDGIGQGLDIIHLFAETMGMRVTPLGLTRPPDVILTVCRQEHPEFLGLTVLQAGSDEDLAQIGQHLPSETLLVAGGPAFKYDPDMAERCGVDFVAAHVAYFIDFAMKDTRLELLGGVKAKGSRKN